MATGWQSAFSRVIQWLRHWLYIRRGRFLPCDSVHPLLCYCCHRLRAKLTGRPFTAHLPQIIGTQHGQYCIGPPVRARRYGTYLIQQFGRSPLSPFIEKQIKEMIKLTAKPKPRKCPFCKIVMQPITPAGLISRRAVNRTNVTTEACKKCGFIALFSKQNVKVARVGDREVRATVSFL